MNDKLDKARQEEGLALLRLRIKRFFHTKVGISLLVCTGSLVLISSFWFPYWSLNLKAPQYPNGLQLYVYMDHVEGDVNEVNILNHYIGMASLDEAAQFERRFAWYGLLFLALGAVLVIPIGRKVYKVFYVPPILFLLGFIGDLFFWLYKAGHDLNPDAPVDIAPFIPTMFGTGKIGQFSTVAYFGMGFWIAVTGTLIIFYAIGKKKTICQGCEDFKNCKFVCNRPGSWISEGKI